eukprot:Opistho-2@29685
MSVMWVSMRTIDTEADANSHCNYGTVSGDLVSGASAEYHTYADGGFNGTIHRAVLGNLKPATRYYYVCGSEKFGYSAEISFVSAPAPGSSDAVKIVTFGDMGVRNSDYTVASLASDVLSDGYTLAVSVGDSSYADDTLFGNSRVNDAFFNKIQPFAASAPFQLCDGNHEVQYDYAAFLNRTRMPVVGSGPLSRFYHSFDYGPIHFVLFSTETVHMDSLAPGGEQRVFIEADLAAADANRANVPWIVAISHHPMYCTDLLLFNRCLWEAAAYRDMLEGVFNRYKVDVYASGHNHQYERSFPVFNSTVVTSYENAPYTVHIVNGAAGNPEGNDPTWDPTSKIRAFHGSGFDTGYLRMNVNRTAIAWEFVDANKKKAVDAFTMTKPDPLVA